MKKISRSEEWQYAAGEQPRHQSRPRSGTTRSFRWPVVRRARSITTDVRYRYTRFTGDDLEGVDLETLVSKLSDLLLSSGFDDPYGVESDVESHRTIASLRDAIREALRDGELLTDDTLDRLLGDPANIDYEEEGSGLERLVQALIERLEQEGFITRDRNPSDGAGEASGPTTESTRFDVTDKGLDFLGYRTLRDLLGSVGTSSIGRARHARAVDGRRGRRVPEAVRLRGHAEP